MLVLALALWAGIFDDARILAGGVFITLLSTGLVLLSAEARRSSSSRTG